MRRASPFVAGVAAGHHEDAVREDSHRIFQPARDLGALPGIGDLVQPVDEDEEMIAPQQTGREDRGVESWGDPLDRADQGGPQAGGWVPQPPQLEEHRHGLRRQAEAGGPLGGIGDGKDKVLEESGFARPRVAENNGPAQAVLPGEGQSLIERHLAVFSRFESGIAERSPFLVLALHGMVDHPRPQRHIDALQPDRQPHPRGETGDWKVPVGGAQPFQVVGQIRILGRGYRRGGGWRRALGPGLTELAQPGEVQRP